jgi:hypothetical protein
MQMRTASSILAATALALVLSAAPAIAEVITISVELTAGAEVPPSMSTAKGTLEATLDTDSKVLKYTVTYEGLTGPATGAHFHGPAAATATAPPVVPIPEDMLASPIEGEATLTDDQIAEVQNHMWYFNIHTAQYPDGEIRGQL